MRKWVGIALGAAFVAFMIWAVLQEGRVQCEVCVEFRGNEICRTSAASDRDHAVREAQSSACAVLASGVTNGIQCGATPPNSIRCDD